MAAARLSIVTCCKGRLEHLRRALPTFVEQSESEVIVVDYDCPERTKDWVAAHFPVVRIAIVTEAPIFNLSRARNVGARLARAPWLAFCDADDLLPPSFASELLSRMVPGTYLRTLRNTPFGPKKQWIPLVCEAAAFWAVGGYDDAFRGWGPEDRELIDRLGRSGIKEGLGTAALVETLPHSNAARSTYYEHTIDVSSVTGFHYAEIKRRYFETRGQWFTDSQRHSTYRAVEQAVLASLGELEGDATFDIRIAKSAPPWGARLTARAIRNFHQSGLRLLPDLEPPARRSSSSPGVTE
jgi:glycosyltransferase involved in cell wall biosynthesis